ncbi:hypothetical protein R3P38DRAFT_3146403, partial [Favolaschia claudopus]
MYVLPSSLICLLLVDDYTLVSLFYHLLLSLPSNELISFRHRVSATTPDYKAGPAALRLRCSTIPFLCPPQTEPIPDGAGLSALNIMSRTEPAHHPPSTREHLLSYCSVLSFFPTVSLLGSMC